MPVLGLCYGGQVLAAVLGAEVGPAPVAELGWRAIETDDAELVPAGPWLEWHFERFCTPPGAIELARTADAPQAFRIGPHLGVQFHPEATVEIVEGGRARTGSRPSCPRRPSSSPPPGTPPSACSTASSPPRRRASAPPPPSGPIQQTICAAAG